MDKSSNGGRMAHPKAFCQVALPRPVHQTFTYGLPKEIRDRAQPGMRLRVPFGKREAIGCIESVAPQARSEGVRAALELLDSGPVLSGRLLQTCRWISDYYVAPLGLVFRSALPPGMLGDRSDDSADQVLIRKVVRLSRRLPTLEEREAMFGRAFRQRQAFETLEELGGASTVADLEAQGGRWKRHPNRVSRPLRTSAALSRPSSNRRSAKNRARHF
jgi:primosomal protein N' (replication factor Y)